MKRIKKGPRPRQPLRRGFELKYAFHDAESSQHRSRHRKPDDGRRPGPRIWLDEHGRVRIVGFGAGDWAFIKSTSEESHRHAVEQATSVEHSISTQGTPAHGDPSKRVDYGRGICGPCVLLGVKEEEEKRS